MAFPLVPLFPAWLAWTVSAVCCFDKNAVSFADEEENCPPHLVMSCSRKCEDQTVTPHLLYMSCCICLLSPLWSRTGSNACFTTFSSSLFNYLPLLLRLLLAHRPTTKSQEVWPAAATTGSPFLVLPLWFVSVSNSLLSSFFSFMSKKWSDCFQCPLVYGIHLLVHCPPLSIIQTIPSTDLFSAQPVILLFHRHSKTQMNNTRMWNKLTWKHRQGLTRYDLLKLRL